MFNGLIFIYNISSVILIEQQSYCKDKVEKKGGEGRGRGRKGRIGNYFVIKDRKLF